MMRRLRRSQSASAPTSGEPDRREPIRSRERLTYRLPNRPATNTRRWRAERCLANARVGTLMRAMGCRMTWLGCKPFR
jgi:hypothetical protein